MLDFLCKFTRHIKLNPTLFIPHHILFGKHALQTGIAIFLIHLKLEAVVILVINLVFAILTFVCFTTLLLVAAASAASAIAVDACHHSCHKSGEPL